MVDRWRRVRVLLLASACGVGPGLTGCDNESPVDRTLDPAQADDGGLPDGDDQDADDAVVSDETDQSDEADEGDVEDGDEGPLPDAGGGSASDAGLEAPDSAVDLPDSGTVVPDGGSSVPDAGSSDLDATVPPLPDAGRPGDDAGVLPEPDAGPSLDASVPEPDAGPSSDDGGTDASVDAGGPVCEAPPNRPITDGNVAFQAGVAPLADCDFPQAESPDKLVDGMDATKLLCRTPTASVTVAFPHFQSYAINRYSITSGNDAPERDPKQWLLQGSNDDVNWTTVDEKVNQFFPGRGETRTYAIANCAFYTKYRLKVVQNNGGPIFQIAELRMAGEKGAPPPVNLALGSTVTISAACVTVPGETVVGASDGQLGTKWFCGAVALPVVEFAFAPGASHIVRSYSITSGNDLPDRDPRSWEVDGSDDGITWTPLSPAQNDQLFDQRMQTRVFTLANEQAYNRYRLRMVANNGSTDFQVGEIALFSE